MVMRIVVPDATSAGVLAERLTVAFGAQRISRLGAPGSRDRGWAALGSGRPSCAGRGRGVARPGRRGLCRAAAREALLSVHQMSPLESWQRPSRDPLELAGAETPDASSGSDGGIAVLNREGAPVGAHEVHPSTADQQTNGARSDYWLEHSDGFQVFGPDGRIGFVALVLSSDEGVGGLVIRTGLLRTRSVLVPVHEVGSVLPRRQRLELRLTPRAPRRRISDFVRELFAPAADPSTGNEAALVPFASDGKR